MSENNQKGFFDGNPKMLFVFGLVTGVALTSLLGGGINLPKINAAGNGSDVVRTFDTGDTGTNTGNTGSGTAGTLAPVTGDEHIKGGDLASAKVVLVEYSDFECPFCERHHPSMQQLLDDYGDDVVWVYRHFPLSFHPEARPAALAAECAAEQDKFWEYGDELFANQDKLGDDYFLELAGDLGLNKNQFSDCYESEKYSDKIDEQYAGGVAAGVTGTPATFINGQLVSGAVPYATLSEIVESIINE